MMPSGLSRPHPVALVVDDDPIIRLLVRETLEVMSGSSRKPPMALRPSTPTAGFIPTSSCWT
jgi:CheY-like chemotaxis protein